MKEEIEWFSAVERKPDDEATVMIEMTPDDSEQIWLGYWDSESEKWKHIDGFDIQSTVVAWAYMPQGTMVKRHACVWASGLIEIRADVPDGALSMCHGPRLALETFICATSRHGKGASEGKLLCPGMPEAPEHIQNSRLDALRAHIEWLKKSAPASIVFGKRGLK